MSAPERTCISCRRKRLQSELVRIRYDGDGRFDVDASGRKSGRGAYICRSVGCVERASNAKTLNHVFRLSGPILNEDIDRLARTLTDHIVGGEH